MAQVPASYPMGIEGLKLASATERFVWDRSLLRRTHLPSCAFPFAFHPPARYKCSTASTGRKSLAPPNKVVRTPPTPTPRQSKAVIKTREETSCMRSHNSKLPALHFLCCFG